MLLTRKQALEQGMKFYYSSKPCKYGHTSKRRTSNRRCIECYAVAAKKWYEENKDKARESVRKYREKDSERAKVLARKYWKNGFYCAKRRAAKLQATPNWVDTNAIKIFYENCPEGYSVDHIIPLQGKNVCGLHVEYNLQYLTLLENSKKGNRYET